MLKGKRATLAALSVLLALAVAVMVAIGAAAGAGSTTAAVSAAAPSACPGADPLAPAALRADVRYLAAGARGGRAPGSAGDRQTRRLIVSRFRCLGLLPAGRDGGYQTRFRTSEGDRTANVIGYLPGSEPRLARRPIVLGAHHDHLGTRGGKVFHGANDNASGVAGMLATAAALSARPQPLRRPVIFVAFGGEETTDSPPYLEGSVRFVRRPPLGLRARAIRFMVNLDMIGTYRNRGLAYLISPRVGEPGYREIRAANRGPDRVRLRFIGIADAKGNADFWPFARRGIATAFFWTPDVRCYHRPCDVTRRLDFEPMSRIVRVVVGSVERLADGGRLRG